MENSYQNSEFPNSRTETHAGVVADHLQVQPMIVLVGVTTVDAKTTTNADRLLFVGVEEWPKTGLEHESSGEDLRKYVKNLSEKTPDSMLEYFFFIEMLRTHQFKVFESIYSPWQWCTPPTLLCTP